MATAVALAATVLAAGGASARPGVPVAIGLTPATAGNLPGGTAISVDITSPPDGGSAPAGTLLEGTAAIGEGTAVPSTTLVYILDLSGSTADPGGCGGDQDGRRGPDTILDCEIAAAKALNQAAIASGIVPEVGMVGFAGVGASADVQPASGIQPLTAPDADLNGNGMLDIDEVLMSVRINLGVTLFSLRFSSAGTNYERGLAAACSIFAASSQANKIGVFLSDGENLLGNDITNAIPCVTPVVFHSFAVGSQHNCTSDPRGRGSLQEIADLTGGTCTEVPDVAALPDILPGLVASRLTTLELSIDGGAPIDITASATPALPVDGPDSVDFSYPLPDLGPGSHELCVTATGTDAGGGGSVTDCVTVASNRPPVADAGADRTVTEGGVVSLDGTGSSDPDGDPLTFQWEVVAQSGPPALLSSTTTATPGFLAADDGAYTFRVTVSDGQEEDQDEVTITVANAAPVLAPAVEQGFAGGVTLATADFTDAGWLDLHSASVDWGDGGAPVAATITGGAGWGALFGSHVYAEPGFYDITVRVEDDDGGVAEVATSVEVLEAVAVWANEQVASRGLDWTGGAGSVEGRIHSNNELRIRGATKTVTGASTYAGTLTADTDRHVFSPPPAQAPVEDFPIRFELADYRPGGRGAVEAGDRYFDMSAACDGSGTWHVVNGVLAPGLYYADCDVHLNGSAIGGAVTVAAEGEIHVDGSRPAFEPFMDGLLFLAGAGPGRAIDISASSSKFLGYLFAEIGEIEISGSDNRFFCGILGNTVDIPGAGFSIRGSGCARPLRTEAASLLVPTVALDASVDAATAIPGDVLGYTIDVANDGASLVLPGVVGAENVDDGDATLAAYSYLLEYLDAAGDWQALAGAAGALAGHTPADPPPVTSGVDFTATANPAPGVAYPATGADPLLGTVLSPGGLASWGYQARIELTPAQVELLLDPAQAQMVRAVVSFEFLPGDVQVRRLFRFGNDLAPELRALSGDATDALVVFAPPVGPASFLDAAAAPGLAAIPPGGTVSLAQPVPLPPVPARGPGEPAASYRARLDAADAADLRGLAFLVADGGVGLLVDSALTPATDQQVPIVGLALDGPAELSAGATATYTAVLSNAGSAPASALAVAATAGGDPLAVSAPPTALAPGAAGTASADFPVPIDHPGGEAEVRYAATWEDGNGNPYGEVDGLVVTNVLTAPQLVATLADSLLVDADGSGLPSPGDTLAYDAVVTNLGATAATAVTFTAPLDPNLAIVAGSVTTSQGSVLGEDPVDVAVGTLPGGTAASIRFEAVVTGVPAGLPLVSVQGTVAGSGISAVLSDDPGAPGAADPTVTQIVVPVPRLAATMTDALVGDVDGDGRPGAGDTLRYEVTIESLGDAPVTGVAFTAVVDPNLVVVAGSVITTLGAVTSDDPVLVDLGTVPALSQHTIMFDAVIASPIPAGVTSVASQGSVSSNELAPVFTDDPAVAGDADPTVTGLFVVIEDPGLPGPGIGDIVVGGLPDDGQVVTEPVDIAATFSPPDGETIDSWRVVYRRAGSGGVVELASGTGDPPATLATLDPTRLANGTYLLTVEATASGGGVTRAEFSVVVDGALKPGRFVASFNDATVAIASLPLHVYRDYDSYDTTVGDFGVGWSLGSDGFAVSSNGPLGTGPWQAESTTCGLIFCNLRYFTERAHYVTVTWPNGDQEIFDFTPTEGSTFFFGLTSAAFTGRDNTTSTLEALDTSLFLRQDGNMHGGGFGFGPVYDPTRFRLTTRTGVEYVLDRDEGLISRTDLAGNTLTFTDAGVFSSFGPSLEFARDALGRITTATLPDGQALAYAYDAAGNLETFTDQLGNVTTYVYGDARFPNYLTDVIDPLGNPFVRTVFDDDGRLIANCPADGDIVTLEGCTRSNYDVAGRLWTTVDPRGFRVDRVFDARGNLLLLREWLDDTNFLETARTYDADDNMLTETDPAGNTWTFTYDDRGNLLTRTDPTGRTVQTLTYDANGQLLTDCDALGECITNSYDGFGNLRFVEDRAGGVTEHRYNAFGQEIERINPDGGSWQFEYDARGYPSRFVDPAGNAQQFTYDSMGLVRSYVDREGRRIDMSYDGKGQLVSETWDTVPPRVTTYAYDAAGNVTSATDPDASMSLTYLPTGEVGSITTTPTGGPAVTVSFDYDASGNVTRVTDSLGGITEYEYDARSLLVAAQQSGAGVNDKRVELVHDAVPNLLEIQRFAALDGTAPVATTTVDYDCGPCDLSLSGIDHAAADGTVIHDIDLVRDAAGNVVQVADAEGVHLYAYDAGGRLLTVDHPAGGTAPDESYSYDDFGNRLTSHLSATHTYAPGSRLVADDTFDYGYDLEGNLVSRRDRATGAEDVFVYDHRNRLVGAEVRDPGGAVLGAVDYVYDASGRLISRRDGAGTEVYAYDHVNRLLTLDGTGAVLERRFHYPSIDELIASEAGGVTRWLLADQAGTIRDVIDDDATVLAHYEYDSFGNLLAGGALDNDVLFQSREFDDLTGLGYFRARFYDPGVGRFTEEDVQEPYGYDFVANNPLVNIDPFGETTIIEYKFTIGGRGFVIALHGGHHSWTVLGRTIFCVHLQLVMYLRGVGGSHVIRRLPLPWCRGGPFPRF